jgi:antitoxin (DNA-binding transcriptional repressor) of toxin-antitoxin stability system
MKSKQVTIYEAKTHLSTILKQVAAGTEIVIAHGKTPVAKITRFNPPHIKRKRGLSKGKVLMSKDFNQPLSDFKEYE